MEAAAALPPQRIRRGRRLVSLAVLAAFLLGALWLASALHVSRSVGRCLAVDGRRERDEECVVMIGGTAGVAIFALVVTLALCHEEDGLRSLFSPQCSFCSPPHYCDFSQDHRPLSPAVPVAFVFLYFMAIVPVVFGQVLQIERNLDLVAQVAVRALLNLLGKDPAGDVVPHLFRSGSVYCGAGFVALSVVHCCTVIPYVLFRLMRFAWDKCMESSSLQA